MKKANNNEKPLALDPYTRKAPCSWSPVHLPTTTQSKIGWQLTPTPDKMAQDYHGKLGQGKGTTLTIILTECTRSLANVPRQQIGTMNLSRLHLILLI